MRAQGASPEALDRGLEAAFDVYASRGVTPSRAAVCDQAVQAFKLDPTSPQARRGSQSGGCCIRRSECRGDAGFWRLERAWRLLGDESVARRPAALEYATNPSRLAHQDQVAAAG